MEEIIRKLREYISIGTPIDISEKDIELLEKLTEEQLEIRTKALEEVQNQLDMYGVQYQWADMLDIKKTLIKKLKEKDIEKIKIYEYILKKLEV